MRKQQEKGDHNWLSLITQHGLFISEPVLQIHFPEGPEKVPEEKYRVFKKEWDLFSLSSEEDKKQKYTRWIDFVLEDLLGLASTLWSKQPHIPADTKHYLFEYDQELSPDRVLLGKGGKPVFLVKILPPGKRLNKAEKEAGTWKASPYFKLSTLCMETKIPLGLITNGNECRIIHVKPTTGTSYFEWKAQDWYDEKSLLDSFYTLLRRERFYGDEKQLLLSLIEDSQQRQLDVTDQLGEQMRTALSILVREIGNLSLQNKNLRDVFKGTSGEYLYEMCLTVLMRLVFILYSEENGLLPHGMYVYENNYGLSHLVFQLQSKSTDEEYMNKKDAWPRILSLFRLIYAGCDHPDALTIAYDSDLFDYSRFPQIEDPSLTLDNRSVYEILHNLCYAEAKIGKEVVRQKVSYRAIDVEQIGSVYESLIGYSIQKAPEMLVVFKGQDETIRPVSEFKDLSEDKLIEYIHSITGKPVDSIKKIFEKSEQHNNQNKQQGHSSFPFEELFKIEKFIDTKQIICKDQLYITRAGSIRKGSGTYYTPKEITRFLVQEALEPLVYIQNGNGKSIKNPREILSLKVCDPAMGSGAFLVQTIRYLSEKLVESWRKIASKYPDKILTIPYGEEGYGDDRDEIIPEDEDEALQRARLLIAQNCIYGVDLNHMAVELAKVSIWLTTMSKDKPLTFLDHRLKQGNSLIGADLEHISYIPDEPLWKIHKKINRNAIKNSSLTGIDFGQYIVDILKTRKKLQQKESTFDDIKRKAIIFSEESNENKPISKLKKVFDLWCSVWFWPYDETDGQLNKNNRTKTIEKKLFDFDNNNSSDISKFEKNHKEDGLVEIFEGTTPDDSLPPPHTGDYRNIALAILDEKMNITKNNNLDAYFKVIESAKRELYFFNWELEFPEVFFDEDGSRKKNSGFDLLIGNPPWDKVLPDKRRFLMEYYGFVSLYDSVERKELEERLLQDEKIKVKLNKYIRKIHQFSTFIKCANIYNNQFPRSKTGEMAGGGHTDNFQLFLERNYLLSSSHGIVSMVLPGAFTGDLRSYQIRKMLISKGKIQGFWRIQNRSKDMILFPNVASQAKICLIVYEKEGQGYNQIKECDGLYELDSNFTEFQKLLASDIELLSPNNIEFQFFKTEFEFLIRKKILIYPNLASIREWNIDTSQEINITHDRKSISTTSTAIPLWEGSLTHQFTISPKPKNYIILNTLSQRRLLDSKNYRVCIRTILSNGPRKIQASIIPKGFLVANSLNYIVPQPKRDDKIDLFLLALINSYVLEYYLLSIISGYNLNHYRIRQLPIPFVNQNNYYFKQLVPRVCRLICTREEFIDLWKKNYEPNWKNMSIQNGGTSILKDWSNLNESWSPNCGVYGFTEDNNDMGDREQLRVEIDAFVAHLYELTEEEFSYILETFSVLKKNEESKFGKFRIKEMLLNEYRRLTTIIEKEKKKFPTDFQITKYEKSPDIPELEENYNEEIDN